MSSEEFKRLVLTGDLTIRTAHQLHGELLDALRHHERIEIDCTDATEVDLTFLQLLIAARNSAERLGKTVHVRYGPDGAVQQALRRAGLPELNSPQAA